VTSWDDVGLFLANTGGWLVLTLPTAVLMIVGGLQMQRCGDYRLARVGALAALFPCGPLWPITLPLGLWARLVLLRPGAQSWFDEGETPVPQPPPESAPPPRQPLPPRDAAVETIRRRVAGPAIGLMITGIIGVLPLLLALLALLIVPTLVVMPEAKEPAQYHESSEPVTKVSAVIPLPPALVIAPIQPALVLPLILAQQMPQSEPQSTTASFGLLMLPATLLFVVNLALSITLIVAGWRMWQLQNYGLSLVGSIIGMLPCTFGWIVGLPMGIWAFSVLQQAEVRQAFQS
jgi:hypothetical protein